MLNRALIIVLGLIIAYATVYFGEGVRVSLSGMSNWPFGLTIIGTIVVGVFGIYLLAVCFGVTITNDLRATEAAMTSALGLILVSYVFGVLGAPFANGWQNRWIFLLLFALVPMILVLSELCAEWRTAKQDRDAKKKAEVTDIRKSA